MVRVQARRLPLVAALCFLCMPIAAAGASAGIPAGAPAAPAPPVARGLPGPSAPAARPVNEAVISRADATAQVSSTAVAYYEKTFGVSAQVARARLASQLLGQGIENTLRAKYGNGIAGVSFDNATGNWVVDVTSSVPASGIAGVFSHTGLSGAYRSATVGYTQSDLVGATADLTGRLHDLIRRRVIQVVSGAGKVTVTVASAASQADRAAIQAAERSAAASYSLPPITQTPSSQRALAAQPTTVRAR